MIYNSIVGPIEIIPASSLVELIVKEKVDQASQSFYSGTDPFFGYSAISLNADTDFTISSHTQHVERFHNLEYFILNSLINNLQKNKRILKNNAASFEDALNDAAMQVTHSYGTPTHAVMFTPNIIVMGEFDKDTICFKYTHNDTGTLITAKPYHFSIIDSPEPCPYFSVGPKYSQYVSNVSILKTMERLGLS